MTETEKLPTTLEGHWSDIKIDDPQITQYITATRADLYHPEMSDFAMAAHVEDFMRDMNGMMFLAVCERLTWLSIQLHLEQKKNKGPHLEDGQVWETEYEKRSIISDELRVHDSYGTTSIVEPTSFRDWIVSCDAKLIELGYEERKSIPRPPLAEGQVWQGKQGVRTIIQLLPKERLSIHRMNLSYDEFYHWIFISGAKLKE